MIDATRENQKKNRIRLIRKGKTRNFGKVSTETCTGKERSNDDVENGAMTNGCRNSVEFKMLKMSEALLGESSSIERVIDCDNDNFYFRIRYTKE